MTIHLTQINLDPVGPLGWFTFERRNWLAISGMVFLLGFSIGNGHTTQNAVQDIAVRAACEHDRADKTVGIAKQAIKSATSDTVPIPAPSAVPKDNCPHPGAS